MNFASRAFFVFLPVVLLIYHSLRRRNHKYLFLLAASWFFYASWNICFLWVLLAPTIVDYWSGRLIEAAPSAVRRRGWLFLSVAVNLSFLASFKYLDFVVGNSLSLGRLCGWPSPDVTLRILLPLGISFHTFQGISYTVDVYRGKIKAIHNFVDFALFVAFFPQLVAGPIVRAVEFLPQMAEPPLVEAAQAIEGLNCFVLGLFKKILLADRLAEFVDPVFHNPSAYDAAALRWAVIVYAVQIYCDFSGYSDMAIGCAKWFGFHLPRNFNFPYMSANIAEFWNRWHMSLSTWMRDYLYIPLGGNRKGAWRTYVNLLATMTLCGLWHGAGWNFIAWGLYNGVLLCIHRVYDHALDGKAWAYRMRRSALYRTLAITATFAATLVGWTMFRAQNWSDCWRIECALFGARTVGSSVAVPGWVLLILGVVAVGHIVGDLRGRAFGRMEMPPLLRAAAYTAALTLLLVFGSASTRAFIYFQF